MQPPPACTCGCEPPKPLKEGIVVKRGTNDPPTTSRPPDQEKLRPVIPIGPFELPPDRTTFTPYEMGWNAAFKIFTAKTLFPAGAVIPKVLNIKNPFNDNQFPSNYFEWERGKTDYFLECFLLDQFSKRHPF
jgi:hypothetical protein